MFKRIKNSQKNSFSVVMEFAIYFQASSSHQLDYSRLFSHHNWIQPKLFSKLFLASTITASNPSATIVKASSKWWSQNKHQSITEWAMTKTSCNCISHFIVTQMNTTVTKAEFTTLSSLKSSPTIKSITDQSHSGHKLWEQKPSV